MFGVHISMVMVTLKSWLKVSHWNCEMFTLREDKQLIASLKTSLMERDLKAYCSHKGNKRTVFTLEFKTTVVAERYSGWSAGTKFNMDERRVRQWTQQFAVLSAHTLTLSWCLMSFFSAVKEKSDAAKMDLEESVLHWIMLIYWKFLESW